MTTNIIVQGAAQRGRPTSDATKVARAVQALSTDGSPFQAAMIAAAILCVANKHTEEADGVGFSKKTARTGLGVASWVRGGDVTRKFKAGVYDATKYTRYTVVSETLGADGVLEVVFRAAGQPISAGYHMKRALGVVTAHLKQVGELEVGFGALTKAMTEVEASHGVAGLVSTFREAVAVQQKPAKVEAAAVAAKPAEKPVKLRWSSCS